MVAIVKPRVVDGLIEASLLLSGIPLVGPTAILITSVESIGLKIDLLQKIWSESLS